MTKYLLLRDNKQSGPYSCDELQQKGLKAYDLVWAEGKSAAWRYPSEIDELKSFAPIVEEQPFERFYKKASTAVNAASSSSTGVAHLITPSKPAVSSERIMADNASGTSGKRIIYVTLPAGKPAAAPVSKEAPVVREVPLQAPLNKNQAYLEEGQLSSIPGLAADPAEDNLSHRYESAVKPVEINPRARVNRRSGKALQLAMVAVVVLLLLAAGVFIGISIGKTNPGLAKQDAGVPPTNLHQTAVVTQPASHPSVTIAPPADTTQQTISDAGDQHLVSPVVPEVAAKTGGAVARARDKAPAVKTQAPATADNTAVKDSTVATYAVSHRDASHRTEMAVEKMDKDLIRNNLANLVSIGASHYTVGTFGGISDLQLTVSNRSVYPLDLVVVEVQYIQANKKVFKTENLYFRGIGAGSALMQQAPKSTRGVKVQYKITLVNSKELGLSYSAL